MPEDYDEGRKSRFNAGVALTERVDSLQRAINAAKFNPLQINFETGTMNYEVMMTSISCLIAEGWDKFSLDERKKVLKMDEVITKMNKYFPPISISRDGQARINKENFEKIMEFFKLFELKIKDYYGNHNLNSPNQDDDEGL